MSEREELVALLETAMEQTGLKEDKAHADRLALELREIDAQNEHGYFLDLHNKKTRYGENQHNLLVPYLLGLVSEFDISKPPTYSYGEFPDIDVDYLPMVRDYLKNKWAPEEYGYERVSNIGSYNTFGIKSALQNMARVFNKSRSEIVDLTTQLGLKDDDGKTLTWEKALEIYPALKKYAEENPDVADAARRLINRNNSMGKHAGGLIVSSTRIDNFVPLVKDKDGTPLSAWVEGLHGQDLGPMGLVKFDLLVITNLMQIALACKIIKERYGLTSICALPGQKDWSDVSYLNDPKAIAMADRGDLKCIFQFDSQGIRSMVKAGGVTSFEDLVAYTALYRPGPLGMKMQERYIERKRGREAYEIHPLLEPILGVTYNVMNYQEQVMQILNVVGDIPLKDCEIVRKAISKKKVELFIKYKEMFIRNGQKNLGWSEEEVTNLWDQIECFAEYGFNRSHACAYTYISSRLLWLKAHYPLEFFAAILSCEDQPEKIREYKLEADRQGVIIRPVDINKSGVTFQIVGKTLDPEKDWIYYGLSNIKGIGEAVAERIVVGQEYLSFTDFLTRFGTDASVMKPLIGLRVFKEGSPIDTYKYYEWFKDIRKKREDRKKRFEKRKAELTEELKSFLPPSLHHLAEFTPEALLAIRRMIGRPDENKEEFGEAWPDESKWPTGEVEELDMRIQSQDEDGMEYYLYDEIEFVHKQYHRSVDNYNKKVALDTEINRDDFKPDEISIDEELARIYSSQEESEKTFYGFLWQHPLERSPDYDGGMTFEDFRSENLLVGPVECRILQSDEMESKAKKTKYYLLKVEDANSEEAFVQVWSDDWERFGEELTVINDHKPLVKLKLKAPDAGFKRYTLDSPPRHQRWKLPKDKSLDSRVVVMRPPTES
jgi:DNA polymerase III alpha subunit